MASDDRVLFSRSKLKRRHLVSQANVRSTVQRIGNFTHPLDPFGRRTTARSYQPYSSTQPYRAWLWYLLSTKTRRNLDKGCSSNCRSTAGAAAASSTFAA